MFCHSECEHLEAQSCCKLVRLVNFLRCQGVVSFLGMLGAKLPNVIKFG